MARGKRTCRILKDIRRQIAEANEIEFVTSECRYRGDCLGTCPKCEAEVRYLEEQLRARSLAGKAIALAGLSAGMLLFSGCDRYSTHNSSTPLEAIDSAATSDEPMVLTGYEIYDSEFDPIPEAEPNAVSIEKPGKKTNSDVLENEAAIGTVDVTESVGDFDIEKSEKTLERIEEELDPDNRIYNIACANIKPIFPGGEAEMYKWIGENIQYPDEILEQNKGRVVLEFVVERDGSITNIIVLRSLGESFDQEAIRLVASMPAWTPGTVDSKPVRVTYTLPVTFRLPAE